MTSTNDQRASCTCAVRHILKNDPQAAQIRIDELAPPCPYHPDLQPHERNLYTDPQVTTDANGQTWCGYCQHPVRYSTAYDEPHYVHVEIAATMACPQYAGAR